MKKKLVTVDTIDSFICQKNGKLYVDASMVLTAGAKDALSSRGIEIVHVETCAAPGLSECAKQNNACCQDAGLEKLLLNVAAMLQQECGVTDPEKLKELSVRALEVIKANL